MRFRELVAVGLAVAALVGAPAAAQEVAPAAAPLPTTWERVAPGATGDPVVVSVLDDHTDAFARTGTSLVHQRYTRTGQVTEDLGGILRSDPGATYDAEGTYVFVIGADDAVWYRFLPHAGGAGPWQALGGVARRDPVATTDGSGIIHLLIVGQDQGVWTRRHEPGGWTPWEPLGGIVTSDIHVAAFGGGGGNYLEVAGRGTDGAVWRAARNFGTWYPFSSLGGAVTGRPTVMGNGVLARGTDGQLYNHRVFQGWFATGGFIVGDATSVDTNDQTRPLAFIARGPDDRVWIERWGQTRSGWTAIDAVVTSSVAAATLGSGSCDVPCGLRLYAVGGDGALYTRLPYGPSPA